VFNLCALAIPVAQVGNLCALLIPVAQVFNLCALVPLRLGVTHVPSPDACCGPPGLRSLDADFASPSMASPTNPPAADRCPSNAVSRGTGDPSLASLDASRKP